MPLVRVSNGGSGGLEPGTYWSGSPAISGTIVSGQTIDWIITTAHGATFVARPNGKFTQVTHAGNYNGGTNIVIKMDGTAAMVGDTASLVDVDYYISAQVRGGAALNLAFVFT